MVFPYIPHLYNINTNYGNNNTRCYDPSYYPNWITSSLKETVTTKNPYFIINNFSADEIPAYESIKADSDESAIELFNKKSKDNASWTYSKLCKVPKNSGGDLDYTNLQTMLVSDKYPQCIDWYQKTGDTTGKYSGKEAINKCISSDNSKLENVSNLENCEQYAKDNPTYKVTYCNENSEPIYINASEHEIGTPYTHQDTGVFNNVNSWVKPLLWLLVKHILIHVYPIIQRILMMTI